MSHLKTSRRSILKAIASTALAAPLSGLLEPALAHAAGPSPLRFLTIFTPHGACYEYWRPQGGETSFVINYANAILAPLEPYRSKIAILDGIDLKAENGIADDGHLGTASLLSGSGVTIGSTKGTESLDQYLGRMIGAATPFRSVEASVGYWQAYDQGAGRRLSMAQDGSPLPRESNPLRLFNRLFANVSSSGSSGPDPAVVRAAALKKSILDANIAELLALQARLPAAEKAKLDQHLTALRDIEKRLATSGGVATAGCVAPPAPTGPWNAGSDVTQGNGFLNQMGDVFDLQLDLLAQSFACDLTRIATLQVFTSGSQDAMAYADPSLTGDMHDLAHQYSEGSGDATSQKLGKMQRFFATKVARVIDKLSKIPEGDGTVLDHTIILWCTDQGNPANHSYASVPMVLAGGGNGAIRTGRYIKSSGVAHNQLLVSIAQAFGQNVSTFGSPQYSGPLAALK